MEMNFLCQRWGRKAAGNKEQDRKKEKKSFVQHIRLCGFKAGQGLFPHFRAFGGTRDCRIFFDAPRFDGFVEWPHHFFPCEFKIQSNL